MGNLRIFQNYYKLNQNCYRVSIAGTFHKNMLHVLQVRNISYQGSDMDLKWKTLYQVHLSATDITFSRCIKRFIMNLSKSMQSIPVKTSSSPFSLSISAKITSWQIDSVLFLSHEIFPYLNLSARVIDTAHWAYTNSPQ